MAFRSDFKIVRLLVLLKGNVSLNHWLQYSMYSITIFDEVIGKETTNRSGCDAHLSHSPIHKSDVGGFFLEMTIYNIYIIVCSPDFSQRHVNEKHLTTFLATNHQNQLSPAATNPNLTPLSDDSSSPSSLETNPSPVIHPFLAYHLHCRLLHFELVLTRCPNHAKRRPSEGFPPLNPNAGGVFDM